MIVFLLLIALGAAADASISRVARSGRIYGGEETPIELLPYQVSLEYQGSHNCGGSIISPRWILTAAHCVEKYKIYDLTVRAGSSLRGKGGSLHRIEKTIIHDEYHFKKNRPYHDVALILLKEPLQLDSTRRPIELFESGEEITPETRCVISGWGLTENGSLAARLRRIEVPVKSKRFCNEAYSSVGGIPKGQICAGAEDGKDSCSADSGGPLAVGYRLAGVVSWGGPCGAPDMPGVYIEVADVRRWIDKNIIEF